MYAEDEDICRDELIKVWRWEGLLQNTGGMKEQEAEGHTILNSLVRSCLLESSQNWDGEDCVKMHDVIRQMAVFITRGRFIARARQQLHEMPEKKDWTQDLINVSLRENKIQVVPSHMSPNCPNLKILMLQHNKELWSVPDLFFVHMKALTVIDLSRTSIEGVPDSVSGLVNLKALLLCWCHNLEHVPSVAQLTKLEVLDFSYSGKVIAPKGLESLKQLEKLPYCRWKISELNDFNRTIDSLGYNMFSKYQFVIFHHDYRPNVEIWDDVVWEEDKKVVYIDGVKCIEDHPSCSVLIPGTVEWLHLGECDFNGRNLGEVWENIKCIENLKGVEIVRCKRMKYVVDASHAHFIFNRLRVLYLKALPDLKNMIKLRRGEIMFESESPIPPPNPISTFSILNKLKICDCPKLKVVFPAELLQHIPLLPSLRVIEVENCGELVEIFESHSNTNFTLSFPNLSEFNLTSLPKLEHIFRGLLILLSDEMLETKIEDCPKIKLVRLMCGLICVNSESSLSSIPTCAENPDWWNDFKNKYPLDAERLSRMLFRAHEHVGITQLGMDPSNLISAVKWIGSLVKEEVEFLEGVEDEVRELERDLKQMEVLLESADLIKVHEEESARNRQHLLFIENIRDLAFRSEDIVDNYRLNITSKIRGKKFLERCAYFIANCWQIHQTGNEINGILKGIRRATERLNTFQVKSIRGNSNDNNTQSLIIESMEYIDYGDVVVGLDDDIETLVEELVSEKNQSKRVLGIIGSGGAGKTTLAKLLYNHDKIKNSFPLRAWIYVSQNMNPKDLLVRILKETICIGAGEWGSVENWGVKELMTKIRESLKGKKYLIVVDDIQQKEVWDNIHHAFLHEEGLSKIILTTRIQDIPMYVDSNCWLHEPKLLTNDQSWDLFCKIVLRGRSSFKEFHQTIGKRLVGRCGGLPLAIVAIAGVLQNKHELYQWENVDKTCTDYIMREGGSNYGPVNKMFTLSYLGLPHYLKPCFLYLSFLWPEYVEIPTEMLIQLWIADGLVPNDHDPHGITLEDVGLQMVEEFARRCIIKVVKRNIEGKIKTFQLHDLMRDFITGQAKGQKFFEIFDSTIGSTQKNQIKSRRVTVLADLSESFSIDAPHVRSLAIFQRPISTSHPLMFAIKYSDFGVQNMKLLRSLILVGYNCHMPVGEVCSNLIHLRFLYIRHFRGLALPESFGNLRVLTTFLGVVRFCEIPNTLWKNIQLKHFKILSCATYRRTWPMRALRVDTLINLQTLWGVGGGDWLLNDIAALSPTVQKLGIFNIKRQEELDGVLQRCPSVIQDTLIKLCLHWDDDVVLSRTNQLGDCQKLRKLILDGRINNNVPLELPPNLWKLQLLDSFFEKSEALDSLGNLRNLKSLSLYRNAYMGRGWTCKANGFPQLKYLIVDELPNLKIWKVEDGAFPQLKEVSLFLDDLEQWIVEDGALPQLKQLEVGDLRQVPQKLRGVQDLNIITRRCGKYYWPIL